MYIKPRLNNATILKVNIAYRIRSFSGTNYLWGEGQAYELNEIATDVIDCINGFDSLEEIIQTITEKYDAPYERIRNDIFKFIEEMLNNGVLETRR